MLKYFKIIHNHKFFGRSFCTEVIKNVNPKTKSEENTGKEICFSELKHKTKVPVEPVISSFIETSEKIEIDSKTIQLLERLSLVDLDSKAALETLEASIQFAERITNIDTDGIEPLYTVLEDRPLQLREDEITDGNIKEDIVRNAKIVEEDYFVAPPGNIPLEQEEKKFD